MTRPTRPLATAIVASLAMVALPLVTARAEPLNPMRSVERSALKGFLERPLFEPTRRPPFVPPVAVAAPPVATAAAPPALQLLGVIHGKRDIAIVRRDGTTKTMTLRTGDHVDGWTATVLPPVGLRLNSGDRSSNYVMFSRPGVDAVPGLPTPDGSSADDDVANDPFARPLDKE